MSTDNRKLDTYAVIAAGVPSIEAPPSGEPKIRYVEAENDEQEFVAAEVKAALARGDGINGCQYYGVWRIWPDGDAFSGELFQYRRITDQFSRASLDTAIDKAAEWHAACWG